MSTIALRDAVRRSLVPYSFSKLGAKATAVGKGCAVLAQNHRTQLPDLAILVNIGVTETPGEHATELGEDGKEELVQ